MHFFYIIYAILVVEIALLAVLLLPLPVFAQSYLLLLLKKIRYPGRVLLALLAWLTYDAYQDMVKHQAVRCSDVFVIVFIEGE